VAGGSPFSAAAGGVRVALRVTPKASRAAIEGLKPGAEGAVRLSVKVTAPADRGKANQAVIALLAKAWHIAPSRIRLIAGETDRNKILQVTAEADELLPALEAWLNGLEAAK